MKLLLLSGPNSLITIKFIEKVLLNYVNEIYIISECRIRDEYYDFYIKNNIHIINVTQFGIINKIPKIRGYLKNIIICKKIRSLYPFDFVHIHNVDKNKFIFAKAASNNNTKLIITYWGSDLLRQSNRYLYSMKKYIKKANVIVLPSKNMVKAFQFIYGNVYNKIIRCIVIGVSWFDYIDLIQAKETKELCKKYFNITDKNIVIAIGYNGSKKQNHIMVLKEIEKLPRVLLSNITILLHIGYGNISQKYIKDIKDELAMISCESCIIEKFLFGEDIARLRVATDIFIHAQVSDNLSATVLEYIYAGVHVLNPTWIRYEELIGAGIYYNEYENFTEISQIVLNILKSDIKTTIVNKKKIRSISSWEELAGQWRDLYKIEGENNLKDMNISN